MRIEDIPETLAERAVNALRFLSVDQVEAARSGHPGLPMGAADMAFVLFMEFLRYNPRDPRWHGRDRFVLSAGHGSALLYSLLHLAGYDLPLEELKRFRQFGSRTPGHPEYGLTPGVETTTGPLGQGLANAVGMALAAKHLSARFGDGDFDPFDYTVYCICSDGDLMEGISSEAASFAGHLLLDNLICMYDDNGISIEGSTQLTFTEDIADRFRSFGWAVRNVDGHDRKALAEALRWAKETARPVLIAAKTHIGYGSPHKQDSAAAHGAPLGEEEARLTREALGWELPPFEVPDEVRELFERRAEELAPGYSDWNARFADLLKRRPELRELWDALTADDLPADLEERFLAAVSGKDKIATRSASGAVIQEAAKALPGFLGGSADLAPSNKTLIAGSEDIAPARYGGRNIRFGIREHAMGAITNGMALSGLLRPFCATFLVFSDYMRAPVRLAALMGINPVFVFTHDSFHVGEDGPTHQPVEHLPSLRAIPGLWVFRPADARETALCWALALRRKDGPSALLLSRQNLPVLPEDRFPELRCDRGAYLLLAPEERDVTLAASGSEVSLALETAALLEKKGIRAAVVSMPCMEIFLSQDEGYRREVMGEAPAVIIEAASSFGLHALAPDALMITRDDFGASAPGPVLAREFGFTPEAVAGKVERFLGR